MFCYYVITVQTHKRLVCPHCRYQTTVTAGTIFDRTRTPLTTWLEVAWTMLQRFRGSQKDRRGVCLSCHVSIPEGNLAVSVMVHAAEMAGVEIDNEMHTTILGKLLLLGAWVQVLGGMFGGLAVAYLINSLHSLCYFQVHLLTLSVLQ